MRRTFYGGQSDGYLWQPPIEGLLRILLMLISTWRPAPSQAVSQGLRLLNMFGNRGSLLIDRGA